MKTYLQDILGDVEQFNCFAIISMAHKQEDSALHNSGHTDAARGKI